MQEKPEHSGTSAVLSSGRASAEERVLDIASLGLDARDRAVLFSMTRVLDGHAGLRLRWVEDVVDARLDLTRRARSILNHP